MRLAAVQLDVVPFAVHDDGTTWIPSEPGLWPVGHDARVTPLRDLDVFTSMRQLRASNEKRLAETAHIRLQQILSFLDEHGVDLCVLPEYALPCDADTLDLLSSFSERLTIVAGLGLPRSRGVELLAEHTDDVIDPSQNVVVVFSAKQCQIVSKLHPAEGERIVPGTGPRLLRVETRTGELKLGVAICKDYLMVGDSGLAFAEPPDVVAIPALSSTSDPFRPGAPRDFPRVFANGARAGESNVFASGCVGPFVQHQVPTSLPAGNEGVLCVDWHGPAQRPTAILKPQNTVHLRSALITQPHGETAREIIASMRDLVEKADPAGLVETVPRWLRFLEDVPGLAILRQSVEAFRLAMSDDTVNRGLGQLLSTHVVSPDTITFAELKRHALERTASELGRLVAAEITDDRSYRLALQAAESYVDWRPGGSAAPRAQEPNDVDIVHFELGFGLFDREDAVATIPAQEDFLCAFLGGAPDGSRVSFVLLSKEDPASGTVAAQFLLRFAGPDTPDARSYFEQLEPLARSVFVRGWSLYTPREIELGEFCCEVLPDPGDEGSREGREDLGLLVDALAASGGGSALEMVASPLGRTTNGSRLEKVELAVRLLTRERNVPLADLVGSTVFPDGWKLVTGSPASAPAGTPTSLTSALKVLHPPDGYIAGRGLSRRRPLAIPAASEVEHVGEGALLGRTTVQHPASDKRIDVRIPDEARTVHTYVIGRTGTGKTNTLKNIVRHDLSLAGAVVVIDPHGDLFDHALRHVVGRREFVALDFAADHIPSVNPLYLDAVDEAGVLRNIDELVEAMMQSTHHRHAGPRFRDIARLCLETLVAVADESAGRFATLADMPALVEDRPWRDRQIRSLVRRGRSDLVQRWDAHHRMKAEEQAELEQWFISKFSDFRRSTKYRQAVSGKPEVSIERSLRENLALVIRVPTIGLGVGPSRFLGSLIVERVLRYTMEHGFTQADTPASLVVDEFQAFVGTSFVQLIPEARKFNLAVTIANQTLSQLSNFSEYEGARSSDMERIVLGNVGNLVVQSVAHADAERLGLELGVPTQDVMRVGRYSALVALTVRGLRSSAFTVDLLDARERPGLVPESSAQSEIARSLARADAWATVPRIERREAPPARSRLRPEDRDLVRGWIERVRKHQEEARDDGSGGDDPNGEADRVD